MKKVNIDCRKIKYIRFTLVDGRTLSGYRNRTGSWDAVLHNTHISDITWDNIPDEIFQIGMIEDADWDETAKVEVSHNAFREKAQMLIKEKPYDNLELVADIYIDYLNDDIVNAVAKVQIVIKSIENNIESSQERSNAIMKWNQLIDSMKTCYHEKKIVDLYNYNKLQLDFHDGTVLILNLDNPKYKQYIAKAEAMGKDIVNTAQTIGNDSLDKDAFLAMVMIALHADFTAKLVDKKLRD